jgi:hypothetical protein
MTFALLGLLVFAIGVQPDLIGMNLSPIVGFVQVGTWLTGLAMVLVAAYATVRMVRNARPTTLRADVGLRLIATGYVIAATASVADFIGIGSHSLPGVHFGLVQLTGLVAGVLTSLLGVVLYWPRGRDRWEDEPTP